MTASWVSRGKRYPPKLLLGLAVMWTVLGVGEVLLAFGAETRTWALWLRIVTTAFFALTAAYYWTLYAHVRRTGRRG